MVAGIATALILLPFHGGKANYSQKEIVNEVPLKGNTEI